MIQAPEVSPRLSDVPNTKQEAINAMKLLSAQDQSAVAQELGIHSPGRPVTDMIWMTIVTSFSLVLLGSFIALAVAVLFFGKLSGELLLTVFTTAAAFLAGLLAPTPAQAKSS